MFRSHHTNTSCDPCCSASCKAARVSAWSIAVRAVHRRALPYRRAPLFATTSVRRRLQSLHQQIRRKQVDKFSACLADVNVWLSASRLRLNASKSQLMWFGSTHLLDRIASQDVVVLGMRVASSDTARDLGVVIDCELSLAAHVSSDCRSSYNKLRQFRPVVRSLSVHAPKTLFQAFFSCRLDYCNSLLHGINDGLLRRVQSVQNAAARLVTGARRCDHVTPVQRQLHWLPVRQQIIFKIVGLVHQSLAGVAPAYLTNDCRRLSEVNSRPPRSGSSDIRMLSMPRTHNRFGDRSFTAAGP